MLKLIRKLFTSPSLKLWRAGRKPKPVPAAFETAWHPDGAQNLLMKIRQTGRGR